MRRTAANLAFMIVMFSVQNCIFPFVPFISVSPNLMLVLTFSYGFIYGPGEGIFYGLAAGLCYQTIRTGKTLLDVYGSLLAAMVLGRVAGGAARWLYCLAAKQPYSLSLWAGAYVTQSLPGMVLHLVLVPTLLLVLYRAGLIPPHYPKEVSKHG